MNKQKGFVKIFIVLVILVVATSILGYLIVIRNRTSVPVRPVRVIPIPSTSTSIITAKVGDKLSGFLIQRINGNTVDGLNYPYMIVENVNQKGEPLTLHIGDDIGLACAGISVKLSVIDFSNQTVTFSEVVGTKPFGGCPICLASSVLIDTPSGQISVKDIRVGMPVWSINKSGKRLSAVVTKISKVAVPQTHLMVDLALADGRELKVSSGHPTSDGRYVGDLKVGDYYNGSVVTKVQFINYNDGFTYDLLPSGDTGYYWANGISVGSTLE